MGQNSDFIKDLEDYFKNTPREKVLEDWAKSKEFDNIKSPLVSEYIELIEKPFKIKNQLRFMEKKIKVLHK